MHRPTNEPWSQTKLGQSQSDLWVLYWSKVLTKKAWIGILKPAELYST